MRCSENKCETEHFCFRIYQLKMFFRSQDVVTCDVKIWYQKIRQGSNFYRVTKAVTFRAFALRHNFPFTVEIWPLSACLIPNFIVSHPHYTDAATHFLYSIRCQIYVSSPRFSAVWLVIFRGSCDHDWFLFDSFQVAALSRFRTFVPPTAKYLCNDKLSWLSNIVQVHLRLIGLIIIHRSRKWCLCEERRK